MIEHWNYAHELNKTLVDLVECLASDFRASCCKLNPTAAAYAPLENKTLKNVRETPIDVESAPLIDNAENKI